MSHGQIGPVLVETCKQITGLCENLYSISCDGLSAKDLYQHLCELIEKEQLRDGLFILVSLRGGSCWNIAAKVAKQQENVELISGLNLSLILSFITKKDSYSFAELREIILNDGIRSITRLNPGKA